MSEGFYQDFLSSPEWRELREAALRRARFRCEFCGNQAEHVHHVRYPKHGQSHELQMLVAVCAACHDLSHGGRPVNALTNSMQKHIKGPFDDRITVYHSDGLIWTTLKQWFQALQIPYFLVEHLEKTVPPKAQLLRRDGEALQMHCAGQEVFRFLPVWDAVAMWHENYLRGARIGKAETNERLEAERFALRVTQIREWGYRLMERELADRSKEKMTPAQHESGLVPFAEIAHHVQQLALTAEAKFKRHDGEIQALQEVSPALRDAKGFLTVKARCGEQAVPHSVVVEGRMNLGQAIGTQLSREGAIRGPDQIERLDGISLMKPVATWRREDIDRWLEYYIPQLRRTNTH